MMKTISPKTQPTHAISNPYANARRPRERKIPRATKRSTSVAEPFGEIITNCLCDHAHR